MIITVPSRSSRRASRACGIRLHGASCVVRSAPLGKARAHNVRRGLLETRVMVHAAVGTVVRLLLRRGPPVQYRHAHRAHHVLWSPKALGRRLVQPGDAHRCRTNLPNIWPKMISPKKTNKNTEEQQKDRTHPP